MSLFWHHLCCGPSRKDRGPTFGEKLFRIHAANSYATPTPAVEAEYVYLHFGRYGTTCLNSTTGETVWERNDLQCEHIQSPGSSLFIYKDKLIVHLEGTDVQHILTLDKRSGDIGETHIRWRMKAPILMRTSEYLYKIVGD